MQIFCKSFNIFLYIYNYYIVLRVYSYCVFSITIDRKK
jgi:hypothetical protein